MKPVRWECPHCGEGRATQHDALRHMLRIHEDKTGLPLDAETNREYIQRRGEEAATFAYERERAAGFTEEQARALAADAELQGRHLARRELGLPTSPLVTTSEYVNLTAPHLGGVQRARRGYVTTAQSDAAILNLTLPRLEARAEGGAVTLLCECGERFTWRYDNPAWLQCDECLDAAPAP